MSGLTRSFARLHLGGAKRRRQPIGGSMAVMTDDHVSLKILLDGAFALAELDALAKFVFPAIPKGTVCLDIGANIGNHARFFAPHFDQVFAFEPHPRTSLLLRANAMGQSITALAYGLSDVAADLPAQTNSANMGGSKIVASGGDGTTFRVERLDDVLPGLTTKPIGFVKLDVEDHEPQAIAGAAKTLAAQSPVIAMEVNPTTVANGTSEAYEALKALGYTHFYHLENAAFWTRLPKLPGRILRGLLRLFAPGAVYKSTIAPVQRLQAEGYPLLIASKGALG